MAIFQSDNPKVALGFAGVVIAVLLVASVAYSELTGGPEDAQEPALAQQEAPTATSATPPSASSAFASSQASGWAGDDGVSDDWGAGSTSAEPSTSGRLEIPVESGGAPSIASPAPRTSAQPRQPINGPRVTTRTAPGAPKVTSPNAGKQPELTAIGQ